MQASGHRDFCRRCNVMATAASARLENPLGQRWRRRPAGPSGLKPAIEQY